ncbi:unnamed protein product [Ectocarpus sp. 12 AP-2014]
MDATGSSAAVQCPVPLCLSGRCSSRRVSSGHRQPCVPKSKPDSVVLSFSQRYPYHGTRLMPSCAYNPFLSPNPLISIVKSPPPTWVVQVFFFSLLQGRN